MEFSLTHILIVFGLAILFFGPSRLPKVGQSLGETIRHFKNALNDTTPPPATPTQKHEQIAASPQAVTAQAVKVEEKDKA